MYVKTYTYKCIYIHIHIYHVHMRGYIYLYVNVRIHTYYIYTVQQALNRHSLASTYIYVHRSTSVSCVRTPVHIEQR